MKLTHIILFYFCSLVGAFSKDKCVWGPTYWCTDIKTAKECNAIKHCSQTVWATVKTKDSSELCLFCTEMVNKAHQLFSDKATQDEILRALEAGCAAIPLPQVAQECKTTVDQYLPELFDLIAAQLDPDVICTALRLCNQKGNSLSKVAILTDPSTYCEDCKNFLMDVKQIVNKSKDELLAILNGMCDQLMPEFSTWCHQVVAQDLDEISNFILTRFDPNKVCPAIGFCPSFTPKNSINELMQMLVQTNSLEELSSVKNLKTIATTATTPCDDCVTFFNDLKEILANNKSAAEFLQLLNNLCDSLGPDIAPMCQSLAEEYYMVVYDYVVSTLDSKKICSIIRFCKRTESNALTKRPLAVSSQVTPSVECVICEFVIKTLDGMLENNRTQVAIKDALEKVCNYLPSTISKECQNFIDEYAEGLLVLLAAELDPEIVCTELNICQQSFPKNSEVVCDVCSMIIDYFDHKLLDNTTEQEISDMIDKVCFMLPKQVQTKCTSIVNTYGPYLIQMLASLINPDLICQELGLCQKTIGQVELLGGEKCLYGPSYWCKSIHYAKACKAEEHCRRHVWKN